MASVVIASAAGLFAPFQIDSVLQGDWHVTPEPSVGTFKFTDGLLGQDILSGNGVDTVRQTFTFHWPFMKATEHTKLMAAIQAGPPWNVFAPEKWDNVDPASGQYWICLFSPGALRIPMALKPPISGQVMDVVFTLVESGRGP